MFARLVPNAIRKLPKKGEKVVVAMSGGVDSTLAAKLLAEMDYDLSAIYMRNWDTADESGSDKTGCDWKKDWHDVQQICSMLDLPVELIDLSQDYWNKVFAKALEAWADGATPNPDIWCNRYIKFGSLMTRSSALLDGGWLATGHYADVLWRKDNHGRNRPTLNRCHDQLKDQTYFLSSIQEEALSKAVFPLHSMTKSEVREIAAKCGFPTAQKKDSTGICFVGKKRKFNPFLSGYLQSKPGPIVHHETNRQLGTHDGLWQYTIGQGAKLRGMPERMFVAKKDIANNTLRLVPGSDHPSLYAAALFCYDWKWIWDNHQPLEALQEPGLSVMIKFRHKMTAVPGRLTMWDSTVKLYFSEKQLAVAEGQVAVAWLDDWCLGCGTISRVVDANPISLGSSN